MFGFVSGLATSAIIATGAPPAPTTVSNSAAVSTGTTDAFGGLLPADCVSDGSSRTLPRRKLVERTLNDHPIVLDASAFSGPSLPVNQRIANACNDEGCRTDGYGALNKLATALLAQRSNAQFQLIWAGAGPEPVSTSDRIAAFYDLSRTTYVLRCTGPIPPPPNVPQVVADLPEGGADTKLAQATPQKTPDKAADKTANAPVHRSLWGALSQIRVASSVAETDKSDYTKRDPAKLSYVSNGPSGDQQLSVKAVAVTPPIASWGDQNDQKSGYGDLRPYVGYERISSRIASSDVNNVDFGLRGKYRFGRYDGLPAFSGALSAAYETDDRFKSSLTRVEASLSPPWAAWLRERHLLNEDKGCVWCQSTGLTLVTDYAKVGNPGDKPTLDDLPQYGRVGFDAGWSVQWKPHPDMASLGLDIQFGDRQDVTGNGATASRLTTRATYYPSAASHVVLGLQYDRGRDLTSLTQVDNWMITWGYRQ